MLITCDYLSAIQWLAVSELRAIKGASLIRIRIPEKLSFANLLYPLLQEDEILRANRYYKQADQQRFMISRAALRILLGKYTNQLPAEIQFAAGLNKKPVLKGPAGIHYNVSHSGSWILIGIATVEIGVDVEKVDDAFPIREIMDTVFNPQEISYIGNKDASQQLFYQSWTRKEAFAKATAQGIDEGFSAIPSLDGMHALPDMPGRSEANWTISSFEISAAYLGAVAYVADTELPVRFFDFTAEDFQST